MGLKDANADIYILIFLSCKRKFQKRKKVKQSPLIKVNNQ